MKSSIITRETIRKSWVSGHACVTRRDESLGMSRHLVGLHIRDDSWTQKRWVMSHTRHGGNQTSKIWISRSIGSPDRSFEWQGRPVLNWKIVWNFGDSRENVLDMCGYCRENLLSILAVVMSFNTIPSVCGIIIQIYIEWHIRVTRLTNESCHTYESDMSHVQGK